MRLDLCARDILDHAPMLRSRSFEETRAYLARSHAIDMDLAGPAGKEAPVDVRLNALFLPGPWVGYLKYGAAAQLRLWPWSSPWLGRERQRRQPPAAYWIHFSLRGSIQAVIGGRTFDADLNRGIVLSPAGDKTLRTSADNVRLSLAVRGEALERHLAALLGEAPRSPVCFAPELSTASDHGRRLAALLRWAAEAPGGSGLDERLAAERFEALVLETLLLFQPHNYSEALRRAARRVAPRDIKRAKNYIHANLAAPISLSGLAAASGVSGRTLLEHFRHFQGVSPMRYVRALRMQRVREELESGAAAQVFECAARWGFAHAGRFAIEYRMRFGESPSATLARGRRAAAQPPGWGT
jgi:AraC-like DNA-binding protein